MSRAHGSTNGALAVNGPRHQRSHRLDVRGAIPVVARVVPSVQRPAAMAAWLGGRSLQDRSIRRGGLRFGYAFARAPRPRTAAAFARCRARIGSSSPTTLASSASAESAGRTTTIAMLRNLRGRKCSSPPFELFT